MQHYITQKGDTSSAVCVIVGMAYKYLLKLSWQVRMYL